ncbi:MAG: GNAT family N-acetyltransferase [Firmicutes bacterium]|jgi:ribosomal protein S18 acetylase RimI-like enzyme|nr:GNAT family N-acetyltransferase [Bacillota bacterium]
MKKKEEIINILNSNLIYNVNVINFINNYEIDEIKTEGNIVLIKGSSDEKWLYTSCKNKKEFEKILAWVDESDKYFVIQRDWELEMIREKYEIDWLLSCEKLVLSDDVKLVEGDNDKLTNIEADDAEYIYNNYGYSDYASVEYIRERIINDLALGIKKDKKLVAWLLIHDDGAIGMLHVLEEYRGNGHARNLMESMIVKLRSENRIPFVHIESRNIASKNLCKKLGFTKYGYIHWVKIK